MLWANEAIAGACAGVVGTVIGFPLDTVKVRMQGQPQLYTSISQSIRKIVREERLAGFYRGVLPPLTSLTILNTVNFSSYAYFKEVLKADTDSLGHTRAFEAKVVVAGACVGPVASLVSTPFDLVKIQLQMDNVEGGRYRGSLHALQCIVREHGAAALYRGHVVNTVRESLFQAVYFGVYEHIKSYLAEHLPRNVAVPVAGGLSGAAGWFFSYPLDCIRTNIQGQSLAVKHESSWAVGRQLIRKSGIRGLYSGITPSLLRAFLVSSSRFSAYEMCMWLLKSGSRG